VLILLNPVIFSFGDCVTLALTWCQTLPGTRTDKKFSAEHVPEEKGGYGAYNDTGEFISRRHCYFYNRKILSLYKTNFIAQLDWSRSSKAFVTEFSEQRPL